MLCDDPGLQNNRCEISIQVNRLRTHPIARTHKLTSLVRSEGDGLLSDGDDLCRAEETEDRGQRTPCPSSVSVHKYIIVCPF